MNNGYLVIGNEKEKNIIGVTFSRFYVNRSVVVFVVIIIIHIATVIKA